MSQKSKIVLPNPPDCHIANMFMSQLCPNIRLPSHKSTPMNPFLPSGSQIWPAGKLLTSCQGVGTKDLISHKATDLALYTLS